jgi:2-polyprenyl-3-methyl-5-hydroxy-6-metoxy-1,4-benzoquinol methylase
MLEEKQQQEFWNRWNTEHLEHHRPDHPSLVRAAEVLRLIRELPVRQPSILEVGCANGWFSEELARIGTVTGIDIADASIKQAQARVPQGTFLAGDFVSMPLELASFDVVVTLETISCIPDQPEFIARIHSLLKPGGHLILSTQNKFVFERREDVGAPEPGQFRQWVGRKDLRRLLSRRFRLEFMTTKLPTGHRGILRIVNSHRLNQIATKLGVSEAVNRLRERLGFGQSIVLLARRL